MATARSRPEPHGTSRSRRGAATEPPRSRRGGCKLIFNELAVSVSPSRSYARPGTFGCDPMLRIVLPLVLMLLRHQSALDRMLRTPCTPLQRLHACERSEAARGGELENGAKATQRERMERRTQSERVSECCYSTAPCQSVWCVVRAKPLQGKALSNFRLVIIQAKHLNGSTLPLAMATHHHYMCIVLIR